MTDRIRAAAEGLVAARYPDSAPTLRKTFVDKLVSLGGKAEFLDMLPDLVKAEAAANAPKPFSAMNDAEREAEIARRFGTPRAKMLESKYREYEKAILAQETPSNQPLSTAEQRVAAGLETSPSQRIEAWRAAQRKG